MSSAGSTARPNRHVSERDQFWLDHEAAQAGSGKTAKEYAADQGLSLHAFYQARKRLRALGLLAPTRAERKRSPGPAKGKTVSFSKVAVHAAAADPRFRLELPGGIALEWAGGEVPESVAALLERLTPRP